ncbi:SIMPL domain-containing protein [Aliigemmobacter aestuarii]|uniref:SIMPL domain-containing protein n=1 Tax=Aliigemmobacter aestuarii TaxID=1445661 RepID=A0A4S3MQ78_9RHOB|nr:SIMPL domain-containing protein [Gemmobacter aestuarii]THD84537.1 SIMPL domain-containing protein [Gemmobacter aestuarii]
MRPIARRLFPVLAPKLAPKLAPALAVVALALPAAPLPALADDAARITVTGEGRVDAAPDMATISLGVTTEGKTGAEAMAANTAAQSRVLAQLRGAGIEDRDIQTSGLSLNPNWDYGSSNGSGRITGYTASNMVNVRVRDLARLGEILDASIGEGANTLNGVSFGLIDPAPAMTEARKRAVAEARGIAETLAQASGAELGRILSITEGGGYGGPAPMFRAEAAAAEPVPVAAGEVSTVATVTIVWEIKE